ncbi:MAG TPA: aldo/keto reductase [Thermomicrobiales bacterium]
MQYGEVKGVGKPVSRLVQGTVMLSEADLAGSFALLDGVYAAGGRAFDTAHSYGGGEKERVLGAWLADRGVRDDVVILGKGAHPVDGRARVTPEDITADLHESLGRLGVEFIDLYVLHRDNPALPVGPLVEVLNEHHRAGKIGAFGGSNWTVERIGAANEYARAHGLVPFAVSSPNFSLAEQFRPPWPGCISVSGPQGDAARAWYREQGIPLFTWSSLAGGFFSGRFSRTNLDQFTAYLDRNCVEAYGEEPNFRRLDRARELADERGLSIPQVALAYVLGQPDHIYPLVGSSNAEEFRQNAAALDVNLTPGELAWLDLRSETR